MKNTKVSPPGFLIRFFRWYCNPRMRDYIEGDLVELFHRRLTTHGKAKANMLFMIDVLLLFRPGIIKSVSFSHPSTNYGMIKSFFKFGWRNLWRNKLYSAINITGLTFGIVCFLLIGLFVYDEMTFDNQHKKADRIYRVVEHKTVDGVSTSIAAAGYKLSELSKDQIPGVENTARFWRTGRSNLVDPDNPVPFQETVTIANQNFLEIFDFPLIAGDKHNALKEPNTIIISKDLAMKIFNSLDVLGKRLQFSHLSAPLKISGVFKNQPPNSSFTFSSLMSESSNYADEGFRQTMAGDWASNNFSVYVLLKPGTDPVSISQKMTRLLLSNYSPEPGTQLAYSLQPLPAMHLHSQGIIDGARNSNVEAIPTGDLLNVKIFSITAIFVLLIAGINYTNLTTARASGRIREIGVRKTIGAMRNNLFVQFMVESMLTVFLALILAILMVWLLLPAFNQFTGKQLSLDINNGYRFGLIALTLVVLVGFFSGGYAALFLSRLKPNSLFSGMKTTIGKGLPLRKGLVVFQFVISTVMIIGAIVLFMQVNYLHHTALGFKKDLMVVIDINVGAARSNFEALKNEMTRIHSVKEVSVTSRVPGEWKTLRRVKFKKEDSAPDEKTAYFFGADKEFIHTYEIKLLNGRNFSQPADSVNVLINESAARSMGISNASGQLVDIGAVSRGGAFTLLNGEAFKPRVIGIVEDFHYQSLREKIEPLLIGYHNNPIQLIDYFSVKISGSDIPGTLAQLKSIMVNNDKSDPFEYHFLDDQLARFYMKDERQQALLGWVALASIFVACLGLFGLATYSAEQRVKEIGVRKVLGATISHLMGLLSLDFIRLVLIANIIACPIAWWATHQWLQEYAYHIQPHWWVFALVIILASLVALLTVSYQAFRVARANPVKSLRAE